MIGYRGSTSFHVCSQKSHLQYLVMCDVVLRVLVTRENDFPSASMSRSLAQFEHGGATKYVMRAFGVFTTTV
jgi:phage baseplate assembly protein gpV